MEATALFPHCLSGNRGKIHSPGKKSFCLAPARTIIPSPLLWGEGQNQTLRWSTLSSLKAPLSYPLHLYLQEERKRGHAPGGGSFPSDAPFWPTVAPKVWILFGPNKARSSLFSVSPRAAKSDHLEGRTMHRGGRVPRIPVADLASLSANLKTDSPWIRPRGQSRCDKKRSPLPRFLSRWWGEGQLYVMTSNQ